MLVVIVPDVQCSFALYIYIYMSGTNLSQLC